LFAGFCEGESSMGDGNLNGFKDTKQSAGRVEYYILIGNNIDLKNTFHTLKSVSQ